MRLSGRCVCQDSFQLHHLKDQLAAPLNQVEHGLQRFRVLRQGCNRAVVLGQLSQLPAWDGELPLSSKGPAAVR